jgi:hypothetical protein
MKFMKFIFLMLLATILGASLTAKAQGGQYYLDPKGKPFEQRNYIDIDGDPFVFNKWLPGRAITDKGHVYDNLKLKYNVYDDQLTFIYLDTDEPLLFVEPIKSFVVFNPTALTFANGFPAIDKQTVQTYYQVLATGKGYLLKKYVKNMVETKAYNAATITKRFIDDIAYYIYRDGKITPLKRNKEAVLAATADKSTQIIEYLKTNNIGFKKDEDLSKLFNYYYTL